MLGEIKADQGVLYFLKGKVIQPFAISLLIFFHLERAGLVFSNFSQIMPLIVDTSCKHFYKSLNCYLYIVLFIFNIGLSTIEDKKL